MYVPILVYHKVNNRFEWGINTVSVRQFEKQIRFLSDNHYYSISLKQYLNSEFDIDKKQQPIIITFDDADESVYHNAFPILQDNGFTATLFVISNYVGRLNSWDANLGGIYSRHLSWEQIIELANSGWEIGSHTANHRDLTGLPTDDVIAELHSSRELIEKNIERQIQFLAYPFGRVDDRIVSLAQQVGYQGGCALSLNKNMTSAPQAFSIERHGVYAIDSIKWFKRKLSNSKLEQFKQRIISFAARGTVLCQRYKK